MRNRPHNIGIAQLVGTAISRRPLLTRGRRGQRSVSADLHRLQHQRRGRWRALAAPLDGQRSRPTRKAAPAMTRKMLAAKSLEPSAPCLYRGCDRPETAGAMVPRMDRVDHRSHPTERGAAAALRTQAANARRRRSVGRPSPDLRGECAAMRIPTATAGRGSATTPPTRL